MIDKPLKHIFSKINIYRDCGRASKQNESFKAVFLNRWALEAFVWATKLLSFCLKPYNFINEYLKISKKISLLAIKHQWELILAT